jgi:ArsR family transcriptional regulator
LAWSSLPRLVGPHAVDFAIASSTCSASEPLAGGASCEIGVVFRPTASASGLRTAALQIDHDGVGTVAAVALLGTSESGTAVAPVSAAGGGGAIEGLFCGLLVAARRLRLGDSHRRDLTTVRYFHNIRNMESSEAVSALSALSQATRLAVFRLLVQHGPSGMAAGELAEQLSIAPATLSFHLKELTNAGLVGAKPMGRFVFYTANYRAMNELLAYLTENCCVADCGPGASCAPVAACAPTPKRAALARRKSQRSKA